MIVIVVALFVAHGAAQSPFCENCDAWLTKSTRPMPLGYVNDTTRLIEDVEQGDFDALAAPAPKTGNQSCRGSLLECEDTGHAAYLALINISVATDNKGKIAENSHDLVSHLRVEGPAKERVKAILCAPLSPTGRTVEAA